MNDLRFNLSDLEIIGYADCLSEEFVPQIVPPIFRPRDDPDRVVMPPFLIEGNQITGAEVGFATDFERALQRGQVTRLDVNIAARPSYRLWIDESLEPHYEPESVVFKSLRKLAQSRAREAQQALADGQLEEAMRLAQAAISADDGCLNAILVKALAHRLEGDQASVEILTDVAEAIVPGADFQSWIDFFFALVWEHATRDVYRPTSSRTSIVAEPSSSYEGQSEGIVEGSERPKRRSET